VTPDKPTQECSDPRIGALLVSYALGTLPEKDAERFEHHLLHCPACQQEMEEAAPVLETLAATREQFVLRARKEKEDFESQFDRLNRDAKVGARKGRTAQPWSWIETIGTVLWGRKWMVAAVCAVAVAVLLVIRHGPESLPPPLVKNEIPEKLGSTPEPPMASSDYGAGQQPASKLLKERAAEISVAEKVQTVRADQPKKSEDSGAAAQHAGVQSEHAPPIAAAGEDQALTMSARSLQMTTPSFPPADLRQLAETALGTFHPEQYEYPSPANRAGSAAASSELARSPSAKLDQSVSREMAAADTLFARRRYGEARDLYERRWKEDSSDVRLQVMAGVASLAQGDDERAKTSLELAYTLLPEGAQKKDVGLLLTRADILAGRLKEARNRLQNFVGVENDPDLKRFAQSALAQIDSFENLHAPQPAPK
jgi:hypothetical protein